ncbi:DUF6868 family protein [Aliivibrio salmonicida]|uniref:DUF6868 family protein n=1 Tax=Aliivibrio salmonicida TaxID=40269 RepID=UPI003D11F424
MTNINDITVFFGWCSVINMGFLVFAALFLTLFNDFIINVHSKILGISSSELPSLYFKYLANYKIGIIIFNLVPYIALKLMV